jgi:peroxisomal 2,4-dienoyl-CoA reductase
MTTHSESPFNASTLANMVALVTGGGSGIGREISKQLGLHGATVVISGRRDHVLAATCASLSGQSGQSGQSGPMTISFVTGDVRSYDDCQRMVSETLSRYGKLDIVINCAAGNFLAMAEQLSSNGFKTVLDIDTLGTFNVCRASVDALKRNTSSTIVNISATLHYGATWYQAHASAAKAAIDSLTRTLALEWGAHGIRVNGIAPGPIQGTAGLKKLAGVDGSGKPLEDLIKEKIPVGRAGTAWDIAMAVVYLCSSAGGFVTGHTMVVDGGEWMWRPPVVPREAVARVSRSVEGASRNVIADGAAPSKL